MTTKAGTNYLLSSARLLGILHEEKGPFIFLSPHFAFSCYIVFLLLAQGSYEQGSFKMGYMNEFRGEFRPFLLISMRFLVPTISQCFPQVGASFNVSILSITQALPTGREKPCELEYVSPCPLWSHGVTFNVVFLAAPHFFSASVFSR